MTSLQKNTILVLVIKLWFFREKITKRKKFLRNNHYFSDFFPTNSDLFTIKTLNEKISKNAIYSQLWSNAYPNPKLWKNCPHNIGLYKPNQMFQICLWCTQILFNKIEPVEGQDLLKEIMILNRVSGSVWKSVIRLRGLDEKDRDVES